MMNSGGSDIGKIIFDRLAKSINLQDQLFVVDLGKLDPFAVLVGIILSQNTNDKNSISAMQKLRNRFGLDPKKIASANIKELEETIKSAGLYKQKARRIKNLANLVLSKLDLKRILELPVEEARKELMKIEGIGPKTADVFLSVFGKRTFGVDTHAARVAKRLGIIGDKADYETVRAAFMDLFRSIENLDMAHRYIISLGRIWCSAKNPKCDRCPIREFCEYGKNKFKESN